MRTNPERTSGSTSTPWLGQVHPKYPPLSEKVTADVAVIGGGIAGLSVAYQLVGEGQQVVLLEDGAIGSGETGRTTAHLASALDDRLFRLEQLHGQGGAHLAFRSHEEAISEIERIAVQEKIECEFRRVPGYLFAPPGQSSRILEEEFEAAKRIGVRGIRTLERAPLRSFDTGRCLRFPDQGQFHPLNYLAGLARAVVVRGGRIYERSHVYDYDLEDTITLKIQSGGQVKASALVVATNAPIISRVKIPLKQFAYRTYAMSFDMREGAIPEALYWDTADPYHYVRTSGPLLIVGGEDHKTGQSHDGKADAPFQRLEAWTRDRFPEAKEAVDCWSGQVMEPADGLAYIGRYPGASRNLYIATGDSGHGMTHGTIAGTLIRDLLLSRANPYETLYDPGRKTLRSIGDILAENLNVLPQYGKWLTSGDGGPVQEIEPGEGRVLRRGLKKVAVCRNERGQLCTLSAVCPHLGGIVTWNAAEKTWDCPAHGSRFSAEGRILNGPANSDLERIRMPAKRSRPAKVRKH